MRRVGLILAVIVTGVLGAAAPAMAQNELVGRVVDLACYDTKGSTVATSEGHAKCALRCAERGQRLGLLVKNGRMYALTGPLTEKNNAALLPLVGLPSVRLYGVVKRAVMDAEEASVVPIDTRRGTEEGVVEKQGRRGEFREGDRRKVEMYILETTKILIP